MCILVKVLKSKPTHLNALNPTPDAFLNDHGRSESSTVIDSSASGEQTNGALNNPDFAHSCHETSMEIKLINIQMTIEFLIRTTF